MLEVQRGGLDACRFASLQDAGECSCFFISLMYNSVERNISELDYTGMVITDFSSLFRDSTHSLNDI